MLRLILAISLYLTPAMVMAEESIAETRQGIWHGVGIQIDGPDWSIEVGLGEHGSSIDYTTTACGGEWRYLITRNEMLLAIEAITYGTEFCLDGGLVRLETLGDGQLLYHWFDSAGKIMAAAVLIPGEFREDNYQALLNMTLEEVGAGFIVGPEAADITIEDNRI